MQVLDKQRSANLRQDKKSSLRQTNEYQMSNQVLVSQTMQDGKLVEDLPLRLSAVQAPLSNEAELETLVGKPTKADHSL